MKMAVSFKARLTIPQKQLSFRLLEPDVRPGQDQETSAGKPALSPIGW